MALEARDQRDRWCHMTMRLYALWRSLSFTNARTILWTFTIADVRFEVLHFDVLRHSLWDMDAVVMRQQNICPQELSHLDHKVQQHGDVSKIEVRTSYGGWLRIVATICYKALVPLYWSHTSLFRFMQPRQNRRITWSHLSVYHVFFVWVSFNT